MKVFIDGKEGTTGLKIYDRLNTRKNCEIITLSEEKRKNIYARSAAINGADVVFLCLPDAAAIEAEKLVSNENTVIIDTSTAHRTMPGWTYGFPELGPAFESEIKTSCRISVPGCHASGFIALVLPLILNNIISRDILLCSNSITGYSGGGKSMISDYESNAGNALLSAPRQYGITQNHKHLKEMTAVTGLLFSPIFNPIVSDYYSGMVMTIPVFAQNLCKGITAESIKDVYRKQYTGPIVKYTESADENGFISAAALSGKDSMQISVYGNDERILLVARYDNLGKGASGAAIQCLNIVEGIDPATDLVL